jgi:phage terminase Nu1 subunit (DNA packaging protein)
MTNTKSPPPPLLTKKQLAEHCSVSTRCLDNWMRDSIVPFRKIGKLVRFDLDAVEEALRRFNVPAKNKKP